MKKALKELALFGAFAVCIIFCGLLSHVLAIFLEWMFPWSAP